MKYSPLFFLLVVLKFNFSYAQHFDNKCIICERLELFNILRKEVAVKYWPSFEKPDNVPLLYFSDSSTYITCTNKVYWVKIEANKIYCGSQVRVFRIPRIDTIPFHMENRMDLHDPSSPLYFHPMMFCSDVETLIKKVPDFQSTEEWMQLVMHEYFHSFQFAHKNLMTYFANQITIKEDSLKELYLRMPWFANDLKKENELLLKSIAANNIDSIILFLNEFAKTRLQRRKEFQKSFHSDLGKAEDFWEKVEGSARYIEYYLAFCYRNIRIKTDFHCDSLFKKFRNYFGVGNLETEPNFQVRSQIMPAYYYVTGFNMCRLLDKLTINYKPFLFSAASKSLLGFIQNFLAKSYPRSG